MWGQVVFYTVHIVLTGHDDHLNLYTPCYSMYIFTDGNKTDTIYYTSSTDYNPVTDQLPLVNAVLTDSRLVHHILSWCEVAAQCNVSG